MRTYHYIKIKYEDIHLLIPVRLPAGFTYIYSIIIFLNFSCLTFLYIFIILQNSLNCNRLAEGANERIW